MIGVGVADLYPNNAIFRQTGEDYIAKTFLTVRTTLRVHFESMSNLIQKHLRSI
jgi:hypothetical protein